MSPPSKLNSTPEESLEIPSSRQARVRDAETPDTDWQAQALATLEHRRTTLRGQHRTMAIDKAKAAPVDFNDWTIKMLAERRDEIISRLQADHAAGHLDISSQELIVREIMDRHVFPLVNSRITFTIPKNKRHERKIPAPLDRFMDKNLRGVFGEIQKAHGYTGEYEGEDHRLLGTRFNALQARPFTPAEVMEMMEEKDWSLPSHGLNLSQLLWHLENGARNVFDHDEKPPTHIEFDGNTPTLNAAMTPVRLHHTEDSPLNSKGQMAYIPVYKIPGADPGASVISRAGHLIFESSAPRPVAWDVVDPIKPDFGAAIDAITDSLWDDGDFRQEVEASLEIPTLEDLKALQPSFQARLVLRFTEDTTEKLGIHPVLRQKLVGDFSLERLSVEWALFLSDSARWVRRLGMAALAIPPVYEASWLVIIGPILIALVVRQRMREAQFANVHPLANDIIEQMEVGLEHYEYGQNLLAHGDADQQEAGELAREVGLAKAQLARKAAVYANGKPLNQKARRESEHHREARLRVAIDENRRLLNESIGQADDDSRHGKEAAGELRELLPAPENRALTEKK